LLTWVVVKVVGVVQVGEVVEGVKEQGVGVEVGWVGEA
jgi:hypothetical protein